MSELKPGRELDALVAEKVFGAKRTDPIDRMRVSSGCLCNMHESCSGCSLLRYSTSIECAWEVLNKFPRWTLERNGKGKYICLIPAERIFLYVSSTAPMAICLAALNASGYVFEEEKK